MHKLEGLGSPVRGRGGARAVWLAWDGEGGDGVLELKVRNGSKLCMRWKGRGLSGDGL